VKGILRSAATLGLVAVIGTSLLTGVDRLTADRIAQQERRVVLEQLGQLIPQDHDNDLLQDRISFKDELHFPRGQTVRAYRARLQGETQAVVLRFRAVNGYSGDIVLLAGINRDGSLRGVRVVSHRETPGLGDAIELEKSDWIRQFTGRSLTAPPIERWAVQRDGGDFDQITGATITPRAIVAAVRDALLYFEANRDFLLEAPAEPQSGEEP
jgi:electron transport complex protein RnfG